MLSSNLKRIVLRLMRALDTPRSLGMKILIEAEEWGQLVGMTMDPKNYETFLHDGLQRYRKDAVATELLRKFNGKVVGLDPVQTALDTFWASEQSCAQSNTRLHRYFYCEDIPSKLEFAGFQMLDKARQFLSRRLPTCPEPSDIVGRFGPGATYESSGWHRGFTGYDKITNRPNIAHHTPTRYASELVRSVPTWGDVSQLSPVLGNRLTFVDKTAKTKRGICIEPGGNIFLQLGIAKHLRTGLRRAGIILDPTVSFSLPRWISGQDKGRPLTAVRRQLRETDFAGEPLHKDLARISSFDDNYVTIDLSAASDSVCEVLVQILFPEDWYHLLDCTRSRYTQLPTGEWHKNHKFSSMGNGYTFELETLIFSSLAYACGARPGVDCFVYGDDIIVPKTAARDLIALLRFAGFTPNPKKTFIEGPFRESCGGDYLLGNDVRAYYLKEEPNEPSSWIAFANGLRRVASKFDLDLTPVWRQIVDNIPSEARSFGPEQLGDLVLHGPESLWKTKIRSSIRWVRCWRPIGARTRYPYSREYGSVQEWRGGEFTAVRRRTIRFPERYYHACVIASLMGLSPEDGLSPRNAVEGYKTGWTPYS